MSHYNETRCTTHGVLLTEEEPKCPVCRVVHEEYEARIKELEQFIREVNDKGTFGCNTLLDNGEYADQFADELLDKKWRP
jgi:hypothetical protein